MDTFANSALVFGYVLKGLCIVVVVGYSYVAYTMIKGRNDDADLYND